MEDSKSAIQNQIILSGRCSPNIDLWLSALCKWSDMGRILQSIYLEVHRGPQKYTSCLLLSYAFGRDIIRMNLGKLSHTL